MTDPNRRVPHPGVVDLAEYRLYWARVECELADIIVCQGEPKQGVARDCPRH